MHKDMYYLMFSSLSSESHTQSQQWNNKQQAMKQKSQLWNNSAPKIWDVLANKSENVHQNARHLKKAADPSVQTFYALNYVIP